MLNLFQTLTATLALTTTALAIHIPANQTEGVYTVTTSSTGEEIFTRIGDIAPGPLSAEASTLITSRINTRATTWPQKTNPICPGRAVSSTTTSTLAAPGRASTTRARALATRGSRTERPFMLSGAAPWRICALTRVILATHASGLMR